MKSVKADANRTTSQLHLNLVTRKGRTLHRDIESISDLRNVTFGQSPKMGVDGP
jgi:hypothetical protein